MRKYYPHIALLSALFILGGCEDDASLPSDSELRDYSNIFSALPEQTIYPINNPYSHEKETLGELLFWDPILSGGQNVACASCHHPKFGWADGRAFSIGSDGIGLGPERYGSEITDIHSPSIMNMAFTGITIDTELNNFEPGPYFWDLRAKKLEEQASGPITNPVEMLGYHYDEQEFFPEIVNRLENVAEYVDLFKAAFEQENPINQKNIAKALATFQRKVVSTNSRFDQFLRGNTNVFSEQEVIGLNKFIDGGCADCHNGPMLSDNEISPNEKVLQELDAVRTPSLRNISKTAPYMQNGSRASLASAISIYEDRDDLGVSAGESDFDDIELFLLTLDTPVYSHIPERVSSGLPVGGDIQE